MPNHQKWFENLQLDIISQTLNNSNFIHTWIDYRVKIKLITLIQLIINLIIT
jgi:hypothetical protein